MPVLETGGKKINSKFVWCAIGYFIWKWTDFYDTYLMYSYLMYSYLMYSYLMYTYLMYSYLMYTYLMYTYLMYSYLMYSYLMYTYLMYSYLMYSYLMYSYLMYSFINNCRSVKCKRETERDKKEEGCVRGLRLWCLMPLSTIFQ